MQGHYGCQPMEADLAPVMISPEMTLAMTAPWGTLATLGQGSVLDLNWWKTQACYFIFLGLFFFHKLLLICGLTIFPLPSVTEEDVDSWSAELDERVNGTTVSSIILRS